jgi:hypothetical protein
MLLLSVKDVSLMMVELFQPKRGGDVKTIVQ